LEHHFTLEQMQGKRLIAICNLKPSKLRGVTSEAMVLCAADKDANIVEFVDPPADAALGSQVKVEGFEGVHDEKNTKVWSEVVAELKTNDEMVATYKGVPLKVEGHALTVKSLRNVPLS
jgi:tRNA-binding EMAP/Myf-like protein